MNKFNPEQLLKELKESVRPDDAFKNELRMNIINEARNLKTQKEENKNMNKINLKSILLVFSTAVAAVLLIFVVQQDMGNQTVAARQGFGELPPFTENEPSAEANTAAGKMSAPAGMGVGSGDGGAIGSTLVVEDYVPPKVKYVWQGQEIPEIVEELVVYKDNPSNASRGLIGDLSRLTGLDVFRSLKNANLDSITLFSPENKLRIMVDQRGTFNIWSTENVDWQPPENIPADEQIISVAKKFVSDLGIDISTYGEPYVDDSFKLYMKQAEDRGQAIMPPGELSVIYPMSINGLPVVNMSGRNEAGLSVSINLKNLKARGVHGVYPVEKLESLYPTIETNVALEKALKGGLNPAWGYDSRELTPEQEARRQLLTVSFDNAYLAYMRYYDYRSETSESYWVPVMVFEGQMNNDGNLNPHYTVVPVIESNMFESMEPPVRIMEEPMPVEPNNGIGDGAEPLPGDSERTEPDEMMQIQIEE